MKLTIADITDAVAYYEANVWSINNGDPLLLEYYTSKKECINAIDKFVTQYKGKVKLDCYINRFIGDEWDASWEYVRCGL